LKLGLGGNTTLASGVSRFIRCQPGTTTPNFDFTAPGSAIFASAWNGEIGIINLTDSLTSPFDVHLHMNSGVIEIAPTVTSGTFHLTGVGSLEDSSTSIELLQNELTNPATVANQVWETTTSGNTTVGSFGEQVALRLLSVAKFLGLK